MAVLLDSTVLIDVLRGRPGALARVRALRVSGEAAYVCAVNAEEVMRGVRPGEEDAARRLLLGLREAPVGVAHGEQAGRFRREFAARGRTLSQADCLVAAAALGVGARLATGNPSDFPMPQVDVEHWPVGV